MRTRRSCSSRSASAGPCAPLTSSSSSTVMTSLDIVEPPSAEATIASTSRRCDEPLTT